MRRALAPEDTSQDTSPPLILLTVCHSERLYREESALRFPGKNLPPGLKAIFFRP